MATIKNCPLCNGPADLAQEYVREPDEYLVYVECRRCGCRGPAVPSWESSKDYAWRTNKANLAVDLWNPRNGPR